MGLKEQVLKDLQENFYKDFDNNLEEFDKVNPFMVFRLIELFSQSAYDFFKEDDKTIMQYVFKEDKEFPDEYTKEELLDRNHHLTVGDLKEFIQEHNIPDHAPVLYQRITDFYFKKR